jgi:hypothetical protein
MILTAKNGSNRSKPCVSVTSSTTNATQTGLRSSLVIRGDRPATVFPKGFSVVPRGSATTSQDTRGYFYVTATLNVYAVQLDTQYSHIIEFIHKSVCSTVFQNSRVHLQERLSCLCGFGKW